jgi:hypothetical protein
MPAHTNSFIVILARHVHALARQSDLHTSTGKSTWRLAEGCFGLTLLAQTGRLPGYWPRPAYQPIWCGPSKPVTVTAGCQLHSSHLSSRGLFLHWAEVSCHILASTACFKIAADLGFKESHVEAWHCDVMAGAGGRLVLSRTYVTNLQVTIVIVSAILYCRC